MRYDLLDEVTAYCYISTFSGAGIGDAGIRWGSDIPLLSASELVPDRANMLKRNFGGRKKYPAKIFPGDIKVTKDKIIDHCKTTLPQLNPWLMVLSPPCQGMSANGAGKLMAQVRAGKKPENDVRNQLVTHGVEIIQKLTPDWFLLENVPRMDNTYIENELGEQEKILQYIGRKLHGEGYTIISRRMDFLNYGIPHRRERLITIGCRVKSITQKHKQKPIDEIFGRGESPFHPNPTHGPKGSEDYINLGDVISVLDDDRIEALEGENCSKKDKFHHVPVWNANHYFWMKETDPGRSAFENKACVNKKCGRSTDEWVSDDVNFDHKVLTDCPFCDEPLPRPTTEFMGWKCSNCNNKNRDSQIICSCGQERTKEKTEKLKRLIRGFATSYRRLKFDLPASTLTMNSGTISSDMKGHPSQNRVLSVKEILMLSTMHSWTKKPFAWEKKYKFQVPGMKGNEIVPMTSIRHAIGESIPPLAAKILVDHLKKLDPRIKD